MIVVRIELWPWGNQEARRTLATVAIANTGAGNRYIGDYHWAVSHQTSDAAEENPAALLRESGAWKSGRLDGFSRRKGVIALLLAVLKKAEKV